MAVQHKRKRQQQGGAKAVSTPQTKSSNAGKGGKRKRAESNSETKKKTVAKVVASGITSRPVLLRRSADVASANGKKKVLPAALDQYFCELVELVPAELYLPADEADKEAQWLARSKFQHNTKGVAPKQAIKEASQKSKKKRAKFDTEEFQSVKQVRNKKEMEQEMEEDEEEEEDDEDVDMIEEKRTSPPRQPAANLGELRNRMNKRLSELQAQRTAKPKPGQGTAKQDRKQRRADAREAAGIVVVPGVGIQTPAKTESKKNKKENKKNTKTESVEENKTAQDDDSEATKIHDALASSLGGNISYGNLDLGGDGKQLFDGQNVRKVKKPRANKLLDVQRLLTKAEKNQERVQQATAEAGGTATTNLETNDAAFKAMEQKALGVTVRDNPKLLKKTLKRLEAKKKKSSKTWAARDAEVKKSKGDKMKKRAGNIAQRSEKIIENKLKRKGITLKSDKPEEKRPRQRPGFEGKRKGNLNDYEGGAGAAGKDGKGGKEVKAPSKGGKGSKAFK